LERGNTRISLKVCLIYALPIKPYIIYKDLTVLCDESLICERGMNRVLALVNIPKLGMRNIKTAISVVLSIIVLRLLNMDPFFACIAAVVTMQTTVDVSFKAGVERMVGTLVGAGIGIIFASIAPNNIFLIALGIVIIIYLSNLIHQQNAASLACIVFLAIMILANETPLQHAYARIIETFIGIVIAVIINSFFFPYKEPEDEVI